MVSEIVLLWFPWHIEDALIKDVAGCSAYKKISIIFLMIRIRLMNLEAYPEIEP